MNLKLIPGAPNAINIKSIFKGTDGNVMIKIELNNQEEDIDLAEILDEKQKVEVLKNLDIIFQNIFPQLINKLN